MEIRIHVPDGEPFRISVEPDREPVRKHEPDYRSMFRGMTFGQVAALIEAHPDLLTLNQN